MQPHPDGHRLIVVEHEGRKHRAGRELIAAIDPTPCLNGVTQLPEPVDVTSERARRDLETNSQFGPGPVSPGLQEGQQSKGSRARAGHIAKYREI